MQDERRTGEKLIMKSFSFSSAVNINAVIRRTNECKSLARLVPSSLNLGPCFSLRVPVKSSAASVTVLRQAVSVSHISNATRGLSYTMLRPLQSTLLVLPARTVEFKSTLRSPNAMSRYITPGPTASVVPKEISLLIHSLHSTHSGCWSALYTVTRSSSLC